MHRLLRDFQPKVRLQFEKGNFIVKTVENWTELAQVLRLRHEVFHREFLNQKLPLGMDMDRFDPAGDHLVIIDKESGKIVGTYRLICSKFSKVFYSASEFDLGNFLTEPGIKLELSRACIHKDFRNGVIISLLWRGLVQYIQKTEASFLFGLASIRTMDVNEVATIYQFLNSHNFLSRKYPITPVGSYQMPGLSTGISQAEKQDPSTTESQGKSLIPPLLNSYLRAGAKVCGVPALDASFQCVDFLTVLKMDELTRMFERKYQPAESSAPTTA